MRVQPPSPPGMKMRTGGGQPQGLVSQSILRVLFHTNLTPRHRRWIPASAGMTVSVYCGSYFHSNRSCKLSLTPISMKIGTVRRTGNHKGCPYDRFAGTYFHTNLEFMSVVTDTTNPMKMGRVGSTKSRTACALTDDGTDFRGIAPTPAERVGGHPVAMESMGADRRPVNHTCSSTRS